MLLHKPAVSQCGLYKIKQAALSTWYGDLLLWHTVRKQRWHLVWFVCAVYASVFVDVCVQLCLTFPPFGHTSLSELPP